MRKLKWPVSLALAGLFIYWFLKKLVLRQVWIEVRHAHFVYLLLALSLLLSTYVVRAVRWKQLLKPMGAPSLRGLLRAIMVGFAALFLVGRAGEVIVRPMALSSNEPIEPSASYASVLIERVFDMVMVDLFFAVNLVFFEFNGTDAESVRQFGLIRSAGFLLLTIAILGIYGLSVFRKKRQSVLDFLERKLTFLPGTLRNGVLSLLREISNGLAVLHDAGSLAVTVSYTVLLWLLVVGAYLLVIRAFAIPASEVSVTGAVFVMGLSMIGSIVPAPGGSTGPFHAVTAASLVFLGVERNKAASAAIVLHLLIFLPAVFFGLFFLIRDGLSLSTLLRRKPQSDAAPEPGSNSDHSPEYGIPAIGLHMGPAREAELPDAELLCNLAGAAAVSRSKPAAAAGEPARSLKGKVDPGDMIKGIPGEEQPV
ncbi:MAG TPA: lysylphosphatidylglycerol synthase transmembrane domain-containing protein [Blastocatellia bacterium]